MVNNSPFPSPVSEDERRRNPRFFCCGPVRISRLPSNGDLLNGVLRNLSLGGCFVEVDSPLVAGARAEILLRVNACSLRAAGQVSAVRDHCGIGIEFLQLSKTGQSLLADLLAELARVGERLQLARILRHKAERGFHPFPDLLTADASARLEAAVSRDPSELIVKPEPRIATPIDLFG